MCVCVCMCSVCSCVYVWGAGAGNVTDCWCNAGTWLSSPSTFPTCITCNTTVCPAGYYRENCTLPGRLSDATCKACTNRPMFSKLGMASPWNVDACEVTCDPGFYPLNSMDGKTTSFCCTDNARVVLQQGNATQMQTCTCSAGFKAGPSGVDGADCVP